MYFDNLKEMISFYIFIFSPFRFLRWQKCCGWSKCTVCVVRNMAKVDQKDHCMHVTVQRCTVFLWLHVSRPEFFLFQDIQFDFCNVVWYFNCVVSINEQRKWMVQERDLTKAN